MLVASHIDKSISPGTYLLDQQCLLRREAGSHGGLSKVGCGILQQLLAPGDEAMWLLAQPAQGLLGAGICSLHAAHGAHERNQMPSSVQSLMLDLASGCTSRSAQLRHASQ